jgi:hypothetical protein
MIGWRFVKQTEDGIPQSLVVDFAVRLRLRGKQSGGAIAVEFIPVFADKAFADA